MASSSPSFTTQEQQNKQVVRRFFEALNRQDTERMDQLVSSNRYSLHFSGMPPMDWNGNKKEFLDPFAKAFPDLHRNIADMMGLMQQIGAIPPRSASNSTSISRA